MSGQHRSHEESGKDTLFFIQIPTDIRRKCLVLSEIEMLFARNDNNNNNNKQFSDFLQVIF